ncbi:MAG: hypothetical protein R3B90_03795 [Planctomycetaceae bacterium]
MPAMGYIGAGLASLGVATATGVLAAIRARNLQYWLGSYLFDSCSAPRWDGESPLDLFICVCDHYEPECQHADRGKAMQRVERWVTEYPRLFGEFRDSRDRPPQHTCFYPADEYRPEYLDRLSALVHAGYADVDIHLHHHNDTPDNFRQTMCEFRDTLHNRHGMLRRDPVTNELIYGFIHGNWSLCNSRPDGELCGVDHELGILRETGCYADFTMPSAPSQTQTKTINSIYYAQDIPGQRKSHDTGLRARVGQAAPANHLLMIQGPLSLDWSRRKCGVIPRIENADLHDGRPGTLGRLQSWIRSGVHVEGKPDWRFVKLHTHGCKDGNIDTLLGPEMQWFHAELAAWATARPQVRYHYVTAWEMARLVHAAEQQQSIDSVLGGTTSSGTATGGPTDNQRESQQGQPTCPR